MPTHTLSKNGPGSRAARAHGARKGTPSRAPDGVARATIEGPRFEREKLAYDAGNLASLYDVLMHCGILAESRLRPQPISDFDSIIVPHWAVLALLDVLRARIREASQGKGRKARYLEKFRQDMADRERYELVDECLRRDFPSKDHRDAVGTDDDLAIRCPTCRDEKYQSFDEARDPKWLCAQCETPWRPHGSAFRKAAQLATGSAGGAPDTMRRSWLKIRKAQRQAPSHWRFLRPLYVSWHGRGQV